MVKSLVLRSSNHECDSGADEWVSRSFMATGALAAHTAGTHLHS
jgi:hypothetical protein